MPRPRPTIIGQMMVGHDGHTRARPRAERRRVTSPERAPPPAAAAAPNAVWPGCAVERANRFTWNEVRKTFEQDAGMINVIMHNEQFGEGGLREVRRLREVEADGGYVDYVAKWFKFEAEKREWYYAEAEAQMAWPGTRLAQQFNKLHPSPPKQVGFVPVFVMEMIDRPGKPLFNVEPLLSGAYEKHNDNDGGIFTGT